MTLDFGIFDHLERLPDLSLDRQYDERLAFIARADALGFYAYHLAEHHQSPLCMAPAQHVFLSAAARATERLRLGSLVYLLPLHHPLRLAEEVCMLDHLSGGRFQLGVGRGITAVEHSFWGHSPLEAQARYEETLEVLVAALSGDRLTHHGRFYDFEAVPLEMTPKQRPYPPLWFPSGTPDYAAREGMNYIGRARSLKDSIGRYWQVWEENRGRRGRLNGHVAEPKVGSLRYMYVGETDAAAERVARAAWPVFQDNFTVRGLGGPGDETDATGTTRPMPAGGPGSPEARDFERARASEQVLFGSPATIAAYVKCHVEETGANYFLAGFQWGSISHAQALQSLELFAAEVMPQVSASRAAAG